MQRGESEVKNADCAWTLSRSMTNIADKTDIFFIFIAFAYKITKFLTWFLDAVKKIQ